MSLHKLSKTMSKQTNRESTQNEKLLTKIFDNLEGSDMILNEIRSDFLSLKNTVNFICHQLSNLKRKLASLLLLCI